ncbi:MAG TPA: hypothetical protein DDX19_04865 [Rhodopirellula baltica]|uniref:Hypothetical immunity region protein 3 n=1 Tax=Rhodopirellula baltica (strain DSM 10527 / NCIMB 13988 / SH1) TaxID=243090 RepID=Q7USZ5_RHOBA|nr:hypothetical immunity region protein 3 [Rhodopirellula baltica SH 1]HBE62094.1 hypothetical protein [Rhodopirellula baltica]
MAITVAVIYCRVSTMKQAESGGSLAYQLEDCLAYCRERGLDVVAAFHDIGSGDARKPSKLPGGNNEVRMANKRGALPMTGCDWRGKMATSQADNPRSSISQPLSQYTTEE